MTTGDENEFSQLKCSSLFAGDIFATFSDSSTPTDSNFELSFVSPRTISGTHTFMWSQPTGGDRAGIIYVHLRFSE